MDGGGKSPGHVSMCIQQIVYLSAVLGKHSISTFPTKKTYPPLGLMFNVITLMKALSP